METLNVLEVLQEPKRGNVRLNSAGALVAQTKAKASGPRKQRLMESGVLFDVAQPDFNLESWTVWAKSSPADTVGRVATNEFRALVSQLCTDLSVCSVRRSVLEKTDVCSPLICVVVHRLPPASQEATRR